MKSIYQKHIFTIPSKHAICIFTREGNTIMIYLVARGGKWQFYSLCRFSFLNLRTFFTLHSTFIESWNSSFASRINMQVISTFTVLNLMLFNCLWFKYVVRSVSKKKKKWLNAHLWILICLFLLMESLTCLLHTLSQIQKNVSTGSHVIPHFKEGKLW